MCKFKHMRLCEGSGSESEGDNVDEEGEGAVEEVEMKTLQLSLHSMEGFTTNKSFKVWAKKEGRKVLTLIDS